MSTEKSTIAIQGYDFEISPRYAAGYILKENEAKALNQTLYENGRNNFASTVKAAVKEVFGETPAEDARLDDSKVAELQAQFDDYMEKYEFNVRTSISTPRDPVMAEAVSLALRAIKESIKAQGGNPKDYAAEDLQTAAKNLVARDPEYLATAKDFVSRRQALAAKSIELPEPAVAA